MEHAILRARDGTAPQRPYTSDQTILVKTSFQRVAASLLPRATVLDLEMRVRHKLDRWRVPQLPRVRVAHGLALLTALRGRAPPRVWAAMWRTLWNGWATSRRTQGRHGFGGCMFRCSATAPDSIEHYSSCQCLHAVTGALLNLPRAAAPDVRLAAFLGLDFRDGDGPAMAVRVAIRAAAA